MGVCKVLMEGVWTRGYCHYGSTGRCIAGFKNCSISTFSRAHYLLGGMQSTEGIDPEMPGNAA